MSTVTEAATTSFTYDGTVFDLTISYADVIGVVWRWTGRRNKAGEPLMLANNDGHETPVSLPDVYSCHGPLIPIHATHMDRAGWLRGAA